MRAIRDRVRRDSSAPEPSGAKSAEWYNNMFETTDVYRVHYSKSSYYFLWAVLADRIMRSGVERILDLGCGPGQFASLLHDKGLRQYRGLDLSPKSVEMARKKCPAFEFMVVDLCHTSAMEGYDYDCVVTLEFLEHVEFDLEVVERIRPGTKVFATVPNFPYVSHVRHFTDVAQVKARYERFFSDFTVDAFLEDPEGKMFFMMEGVRAPVDA